MTFSFKRTARATVLCVALAGCVPWSSTSSAPSPAQAERDWTTLLAQVSQEIQAGRYGAVDQLLADYVAQHPNGGRTADALYWRALYRLDPANPASSSREAGVLLDSVLASPLASSRRADALALRRIASALEARAAVVAAPAPPPPSVPASRGDDRAREEELARLKDELAKANAELERIKKRLAAPKP